MKAAIDYDRQDVRLEQLITHEFPLEDIDAALRTTSDPDHALNVTIRFQ